MNRHSQCGFTLIVLDEWPISFIIAAMGNAWDAMLTPLQMWYLLLVAAVGLSVLLIGMRLAIRLKELRLKRLRNKDRMQSIFTDSPVEQPKQVARDRAAASIRKQHTIVRRIFVPVVLVAAGMLGVLPFVGYFPAAVLSVFVAVVTVVLGIAARPIVENIFAGLTISYSRFLSIGDIVQLDGYYGSVEDISPTHTVIKIWDWRRYVLPNAKMLQTNFINLSLYDKYTWTRVEFTVAPDAPLDQLESEILEFAKQSPYFADHEPPRLWINELTQSSVRCLLVAWADSPGESWLLANDIRRGVQALLRDRGVCAGRWSVGLGRAEQDLGVQGHGFNDVMAEPSAR